MIPARWDDIGVAQQHRRGVRCEFTQNRGEIPISPLKFHEEELKKRNIHFTTTVCQDRDQNAADLICDYGERKEVDFIVLGREVKDNKLIGSISHRVVSHSKKTAVVVKYMP